MTVIERCVDAYERMQIKCPDTIPKRILPWSQMKHLESPSPAKETIKPKAPLSMKHAALIAAILVGGIGYGMTTWWSPLPSDHISDQRKAELITEFTKIREVKVEAVKAQEINAVLDTMRLEPSSRQTLEKTLQSTAGTPAPTLLVELVLWDFASEDGDVVSVSSAGYEAEFLLKNEPQKVVVPVDGSRTIQITGVRDGGGGITMGVHSGDGKLSLPVMSEGQVLTLPVSF